MTHHLVDGGLIVLAGLPGSGKSTIAAYLASRHGYAIASRDVIRSAMFPLCRYTAEEKSSAFSAMKAAIGTMLDLGITVTTDGICFSSAAELEEVLDVARRRGRRPLILHCECTVELAQQRVEEDRRRDPDGVPADRDAHMVQVTADRFEPLPPSSVAIDTSSSIDEVRRRVDAALASHEARR